jgi:hypothetical protein
VRPTEEATVRGDDMVCERHAVVRPREGQAQDAGVGGVEQPEILTMTGHFYGLYGHLRRYLRIA